MALPLRPLISFQDYVWIETNSTAKHEWVDGVVYAMAGGTAEHARLASRVGHLLTTLVSGRACNVYSSDLRVRSRKSGLATYADVTVICGKPEYDPEDQGKATALNPMILVEVLSPSTEAYDRGDKLAHYKQIDSVQVVLLVAHDGQRIEAWRRTPTGWENAVHRANDSVPLPELGGALSVAEVYFNPVE